MTTLSLLLSLAAAALAKDAPISRAPSCYALGDSAYTAAQCCSNNAKRVSNDMYECIKAEAGACAAEDSFVRSSDDCCPGSAIKLITTSPFVVQCVKSVATAPKERACSRWNEYVWFNECCEGLHPVRVSHDMDKCADAEHPVELDPVPHTSRPDR